MISKSCEYGMRAMIYLAILDLEVPISISKISSDLNLSFHYLTKILQELTAVDLLNSTKGAKGGVKLTKNPDDITLYDIVKAIDGEKVFNRCALGLPDCNDRKSCPAHEEWSKLKNQLESFFLDRSLIDMAKSTTVEDLIDMDKKNAPYL